jgi:integrase/recombinase XerC
MRLSALFEEFCMYLRAEQGAAPSSIRTYRYNFGDFMDFARREVGGPVTAAAFTVELCRAYQYALISRELASETVRTRLATLGSFARWCVRRGKLATNPLEQLTRPRRRKRLPRVVPRWTVVEALIADPRHTPRDRALLALMAYGGLRRSELVALNVGDFDPGFGLRRVTGKGGHESGVALPRIAREIIAQYLAADRPGAAPTAPMFVVSFRNRWGAKRDARMHVNRVWKIIKRLGQRAGLPELHPHAFRHACGTELLFRTKDLRAVQEHLRHADIQTTTIYTRLAQPDLARVVGAFDGVSAPRGEDQNSG